MTSISDEEWLQEKILEKRKWLEQGRLIGVDVESTARKLGKMNSSSKHFAYELLQNADDCQYPEGVEPFLSVRWSSENGVLEVAKNENGFSRQDVLSITGLGASTKTRCHDEQCRDCSGEPEGGVLREPFEEPRGHGTGNKGVGFKSFVEECHMVTIVSRNFRFQLTRESPMLPRYMSEMDLLEQVGDISSEAQDMMRQRTGSVILAKTLENFHHLADLIHLNDVRYLRVLKKIKLGSSIVQCIPPKNFKDTWTLERGRDNISFLRIKFCLPTSSAPNLTWQPDSSFYAKKKFATIMMDFDEVQSPVGGWYATLPLNGVRMKIPFHVNAPFITTTTRETFMVDSTSQEGLWNKHLLNQIEVGLIIAFERFQERGQEFRFFEFLPCPSQFYSLFDDEKKTYDDMCFRVFSYFRNQKCVPGTEALMNPEAICILEEHQSSIFGGDLLNCLWELSKGQRSFTKECNLSSTVVENLTKLGAKRLSDTDIRDLLSHLSETNHSEEWYKGVEKFLMNCKSIVSSSLRKARILWCHSCRAPVAGNDCLFWDEKDHEDFKQKTGKCLLQKVWSDWRSPIVDNISGNDVILYIRQSKMRVSHSFYEFFRKNSGDLHQLRNISWIPTRCNTVAVPEEVFFDVSDSVLSVFPHIQSIASDLSVFQDVWRAAGCRCFTVHSLVEAFKLCPPSNFESFYELLPNFIQGFSTPECLMSLPCLYDLNQALVAPSNAIFSTGILMSLPKQKLNKCLVKVENSKHQKMFRHYFNVVDDLEFFLSEKSQLEEVILSLNVEALNDMYRVLIASASAHMTALKKSPIFRVDSKTLKCSNEVWTCEHALIMDLKQNNALPSGFVFAEGDSKLLSNLGVLLCDPDMIAARILEKLSVKASIPPKQIRVEQTKFLIKRNIPLKENIYIDCSSCNDIHKSSSFCTAPVKSTFLEIFEKACVFDNDLYQATDEVACKILNIQCQVSVEDVINLDKLNRSALKFLNNKTTGYCLDKYLIETATSGFVNPKEVLVIRGTAFELFKNTVVADYLICVDVQLCDYWCRVLEIRKEVCFDVIFDAYCRAKVADDNEFLSWLELLSGSSEIKRVRDANIVFQGEVMKAESCAWFTDCAPDCSKFCLKKNFHKYERLFLHCFGTPAEASGSQLLEVVDQWIRYGFNALDVAQIKRLYSRLCKQGQIPKIFLARNGERFEWISRDSKMLFFCDRSSYEEPFEGTEVWFVELEDYDIAKIAGLQILSEHLKKTFHVPDAVDKDFILEKWLFHLIPFVNSCLLNLGAQNASFPPKIVKCNACLQVIMTVGEVKSNKIFEKDVLWGDKKKCVVMNVGAEITPEYVDELISLITEESIPGLSQDTQAILSRMLLKAGLRLSFEENEEKILSFAEKQCMNFCEKNHWKFEKQEKRNEKIKQKEDDTFEDEGNETINAIGERSGGKKEKGGSEIPATKYEFSRATVETFVDTRRSSINPGNLNSFSESLNDSFRASKSSSRNFSDNRGPSSESKWDSTDQGQNERRGRPRRSHNDTFWRECEEGVFEKLKEPEFLRSFVPYSEAEQVEVQNVTRRSFEFVSGSISGKCCWLSFGNAPSTVDINISYNINSSKYDRHIEVKSSVDNSGFELTPNQWAFAKLNPNTFYVVYVTIRNQEPHFLIMNDVPSLVQSTERIDFNQISASSFGVTFKP